MLFRSRTPILATMLLAALAGCRPGEAATGQAVEVAWTVPLPEVLTGLSLAEPWLAIDPRDPSHLVGAGMAVGVGQLQSVVVSSRDGGRSWTVGRSAESDDILFPSGDPMVAMSPEGIPHFTTLHDGFSVWKAVGGDTLWSRAATVPGGRYDRQWLAFDGSGGERHGRLYSAGKIGIQVTGSRAEDVAAFSWSDDGAESFRDPVLVLPDPDQGSLNVVAGLQVLADGSLVAPYRMLYWWPPGPPPALLDGEMAVLRSLDGRRWEEPVRVGSLRKWGHGAELKMLKGMSTGGLVVGPGLEGEERLHLVWLDVLDGWLQVVTAHSVDGGRSWSEPVRVSRGGQQTNQANPGIAVDGRGRVAVLWNDRRNDQSERCFQPYVAVSYDGGRTFGREVPVSDDLVCPPGGRWLAGGDTQGIVGFPDGGFQLLWVGGAERPDVPYRLFSSRVEAR